jgi:hypothetical protein
MKAEKEFIEYFVKNCKEIPFDFKRQRFNSFDMIDFAQQFAEKYARIQIEKDREETKRLMNDKLKDFEGMNPEIEAIIDRHIILD